MVIHTAALIGLGALGLLFGAPLEQHYTGQPGSSFQVIADEKRIAKYTSHPITVNGTPRRFSYVTPEAGTPVDFILVAVKSTTLDSAIRDIARFVGPDTVIVSVLNGITSEERLEAAYPGHTLWSVAIDMDATRIERDLVYHQPGRIQFGERNGAMTPRVAAVDAYLAAAGIGSEPCSDILYKQWFKLMINDGLNQATAAYDLPYGRIAQPCEAHDVMLAAMDEVIALANLEGAALPQNCSRVWVETQLCHFNPDGMPSMRQDVLAKRPTEVEEFSGVVRARAAKHGLATPANDMLYAKIKAVEAAY